MKQPTYLTTNVNMWGMEMQVVEGNPLIMTDDGYYSENLDNLPSPPNGLSKYHVPKDDSIFEEEVLRKQYNTFKLEVATMRENNSPQYQAYCKLFPQVLSEIMNSMPRGEKCPVDGSRILRQFYAQENMTDLSKNCKCSGSNLLTCRACKEFLTVKSLF